MDWNALLSNVLQAVLVIVLPPLVVFAAKWLRARAEQALAEASAWQPDLMALLERAAGFAVSAAEQAGAAGFVKDKKVYALDLAEKWLETKGIAVDLDMIDAAVEKAVLELKRSAPADG